MGTTTTCETLGADDGTLGWWLRFAEAVETIYSRAGRLAHQEQVRLAILDRCDRLSAWNTRVCGWIDISVTMAVEP